MEEIVEKILKAKETRALQREQIANQGKLSLSMNLNVPGYPKSNKTFKLFFEDCLLDLKRYLLSHRISVQTSQEIKLTDPAGDFFVVPLLNGETSANEIKTIAETFETSHPLGRLIDVDITDKEGNPVSSGKAKQCYFCNQHPAIYCMRTEQHAYSKMRSKIEADIHSFLGEKKKQRVCRNLAALALKALLHEAALSPKPGLVDRFSAGSHTDMDFTTFLNSSAVLSTYFQEIAGYAYSYSDKNCKNALPRLRQIGLLMEEDMFRETNGVNTHKGAIFLLGFSLFVSANLIARENYSYTSFASMLKDLNVNLVEKELGKKRNSEEKTHGEECFEKYGTKGCGIRGEIQEGLPSVFHHAIPVLDQHLKNQNTVSSHLLQKSLTHALLVLLANNNDSNILYRKGEKVLLELKRKAQNVLDVFETEAFDSKYRQLIGYCREEHISPGGSADLLAVSYFVHESNKLYGK